jgi:hypothetical protein
MIQLWNQRNCSDSAAPSARWCHTCWFRLFHCSGSMVDSLFLFQSASKIKNSYLLGILLILPN